MKPTAGPKSYGGDPPPHGPLGKARPSQAVRPMLEADGCVTCEVDPDFLEHIRREAGRQGQLLWDD